MGNLCAICQWLAAFFVCLGNQGHFMPKLWYNEKKPWKISVAGQKLLFDVRFSFGARCV